MPYAAPEYPASPVPASGRSTAQKPVRRLRFRPIPARSGNARCRLVGKPRRQFHQPLIQSFITQCRSGKLFHRPHLHRCLSIEKTTRKQQGDQIAAVNRKIDRNFHQIRSDLCELSCVERYALEDPESSAREGLEASMPQEPDYRLNLAREE